MRLWRKLLITTAVLFIPLIIGLQTTAASEAIYSKGSVLKEYHAVFDIPAGASEYTQGKIERFNYDKFEAPQRSVVISFIYKFSKTFSDDFLLPITVNLPYRPLEYEPQKHILSIYWYDEELKLWIELDNVSINEEKETVSGQTQKVGYFAVIASERSTGKPQKPAEPEPPAAKPEPEVKKPIITSYPDIENHWAKAAIVQMLELEAMKGYPGGAFKPAQAITRAEFTVAIVKSFNLWSETGYNFSDTLEHWAREEISIAAANRIIAGYNDRQFGPDDTITREQMAVILIKAARLNPASGALSFADNDKISPWAYGSIVMAINKKLISGYPDNTFDPQGTASRSEAATVISKTIQNTTILVNPKSHPVILE